MGTQKTEISGYMLIGIVSAFEEINAIDKYELDKLLKKLDPKKWYSFTTAETYFEKIIDSVGDYNLLLFEAGYKFMKIWYNNGGSDVIKNVFDYIELQKDSAGYNIVMRSETNCLITDIISHDKAKGELHLLESTPFKSEFVKGVYYCGMLLTGDVKWVNVEVKPSSANSNYKNDVFIKYKMKPSTITEKRINKTFDSIFSDSFSPLDEDSQINLLLENNFLKEELKRKEEYWKIVNRKLKKTSNELHKTALSLEELSTIDSLTKVYNRRKIDEIIKVEIQKHQREGKKLSLIMYDLDNFKYVNDNFGHSLGDKVLIKITNKVKSILRSLDYISRIGGDEFLILLPDTGSKEAYQIASKISTEINNLAINLDETPIKMTLSIGIYTIKEHDNFLETYINVDKAMYKSKNNGKNKISFY